MKLRCPNEPWDKSQGYHYHEYYLADDGTLDTVVEVDGREYRFSTEYASQYRRRDGSMTAKGLRALAQECLDTVHELEEEEANEPI